MSEATKTLGDIKHPETVTKNRRYQVFDATVDTNEIVTLTVGTLVATGVWKLSDGTAVTHTKTGAYITITEAALTDERVIGFGMGSAS